MFGISFTEILLVAVVAIVVVGPQKLPYMLGRIGTFIGKMRRIATEMRQQTGIDEILRAEGLEGGLSELRGMVRGNLSHVGRSAHTPAAGGMADPYGDHIEYDRTREYPVEGPDTFDAIPEDLAGDLDADADPGTVPVTEANAAPSDDTASATATGTEDAPTSEPTEQKATA